MRPSLDCVYNVYKKKSHKTICLIVIDKLRSQIMNYYNPKNVLSVVMLDLNKQLF